MLHDLGGGRGEARCDKCMTRSGPLVGDAKAQLRTMGWTDAPPASGVSGRWWCPPCVAGYKGEVTVPKRGKRR